MPIDLGTHYNSRIDKIINSYIPKEGDTVILHYRTDSFAPVGFSKHLRNILENNTPGKIIKIHNNEHSFVIMYGKERFTLTKSYYGFEKYNEFELPEGLFRI